MKNLTIIFAQFGFRASMLEPTYSSFKKYFGDDTNFTLYTDDVLLDVPNVKCRSVHPPYSKLDSRYGNRCNDLYKGIGLMESETEYSIAVDNDMRIMSNDVLTIIPFIKKFGLCLPANPRLMVKVDNSIGIDSDKKFDETKGCGYISNMSPIGFYKENIVAKKVLSNYCNIMTSNPVRGPVAMWRAIWDETSLLNPYLLPPQWCVCAEDCGVGNEIILHVGHDKVRKHYGVKI